MMGNDSPPQLQLLPTSSMVSELDSHKNDLVLHSDSSEPLSEEDIACMRSRMVDMGFGIDYKLQNTLSVENLLQREKELGGMVRIRTGYQFLESDDWATIRLPDFFSPSLTPYSCTGKQSLLNGLSCNVIISSNHLKRKDSDGKQKEKAGIEWLKLSSLNV